MAADQQIFNPFAMQTNFSGHYACSGVGWFSSWHAYTRHDNDDIIRSNETIGNCRQQIAMKWQWCISHRRQILTMDRWRQSLYCHSKNNACSRVNDSDCSLGCASVGRELYCKQSLAISETLPCRLFRSIRTYIFSKLLFRYNKLCQKHSFYSSVVANRKNRHGRASEIA